MAKKYLTIKEAAKELGVSTKTVRRWEEQGKIESIRTSGGHRRFRLKEVAPEKTITLKKIFPYILATSIISGGLSFTATHLYYINQNRTIKGQLDSYLNQVNKKEIIINNPDNNAIIDSGVSVIKPDDDGNILVKSEAIKDHSGIFITSEFQDNIYVSQVLSGIGFIVSTKESFSEPIYFNWQISN